jgi:hypothetical protein
MFLNASYDFLKIHKSNLIIKPKNAEDVGNYTIMITLID